MKKLYCFAICAALLLSLCACGKQEEPELVYIDEGTEETEEMALRDVSVLCTAGMAQKDTDFWSKLAAEKQSETYTYLTGYVGMVDLGGVISEDENASYERIELMNYLGYDAAVPAAADFASGVQFLLNGANTADYPLLCCNLYAEESASMLLASWTLTQYGGLTAAYIGLTLPETVDDSQLSDEQGNSYILAESEICLQEAANDARNAGAAYVIVLCSCGREAAEALMENISGVDAFLDGSGDGSCGQLSDSEGKSCAYLGLNPETESVGQLVIRENGSLETAIISDLDAVDENMNSYLSSLGYELDSPEETESESISE